MARPSANPLPTCPRCGYDQSGVTASWADQCPVRGTCSECGLAFEWRDLLNPRFGRLPWLFEHARGVGVRAMAASMWTASIPGRFWSRVRMSHQIRAGRLVLMLALVGLHLLTGVNRVGCQLVRARSGAAIFRHNYPNTMRFGHAVTPSWHEAWFELSDGGDPLVVAAKILDIGTPVHPAPRWREDRVSVWRVPSRWLPALHICAPLLLLALPHTRAVAKVRPLHLLRAGAYPLTLTICLWYLGLTAARWLDAWNLVQVPRAERPPLWLEASTLAVGLSWSAWWWLGACRTYLRLPRPLLVWGITCFVSVFATAAMYASAFSRQVGYLLRDVLL